MKYKKNLPRRKLAVILLSGGLDSAVTLYSAKKYGFKGFCLIFDYGQRHKREIKAAKKIARVAHCKWRVIKINLPWKGSSLLNKRIPLCQQANGSIGSPSLETSRAKSRDRQTGKQANIPLTYVPGRNIIFLSFALSYAETIGAEAIFIGAHIQDYSGYPDCRPEFYQAFQRVIKVGTKSGVEGKKISILTPLVKKTKAQIIKMGLDLGVPFEFTWSCYQGAKFPCGKCDSCYFRAKGFQEIGIEDPLLVKEI